MWSLNDVVLIEYKEGYRYLVEFDDGMRGIVDFSSYLEHGPVFQALTDMAIFRAATIEGGTIAWPNGVDIAPETLYDKVSESRSNSTQSVSR